MSGGPGSQTRVRELLSRLYGESASTEDGAFARAGMRPAELIRLHELALRPDVREVLEVGMANGTSSVVILDALSANGRKGSLTSIDPYQTTAFSGGGVDMVRKAGFEQSHRLIERPDYLVMPELVCQQKRFDLILVDGWHSFDYTLLDVFYADLLLREKGILAVHDSADPPVFSVLEFLVDQKPYRLLSPPPSRRLEAVTLRLLRRIKAFARGNRARASARSRRQEWFSLAAYEKLANQEAPERVEMPWLLRL